MGLQWHYGNWEELSERYLLLRGCKMLSYARRVQIALNKGEAKNALARAVFLNRLGEIRDRNFR
jgi:TnpA family transposase